MNEMVRELYLFLSASQCSSHTPTATTAVYMNDASFSWSSSGSAAEEDAGSERGREEGEREEEREGEREGEREEERERGERDGEERVERKQRRYVWTLSNITLNVPHVR